MRSRTDSKFSSSFSASRRPKSILRTSEPVSKSASCRGISWNSSKADQYYDERISQAQDEVFTGDIMLDDSGRKDSFDDAGHDAGANVVDASCQGNSLISRTQGVLGSFDVKEPSGEDNGEIHRPKKRRSLLDRAAAATSKPKTKGANKDPEGRHGGRQDLNGGQRPKTGRDRARRRGSLAALVGTIKHKSGPKHTDEKSNRSDEKTRTKRRGSLAKLVTSIKPKQNSAKYANCKISHEGVDVHEHGAQADKEAGKGHDSRMVQDGAGKRGSLVLFANSVKLARKSRAEVGKGGDRRPRSHRRAHNGSKRNELSSSLLAFDKLASEKNNERGSLLSCSGSTNATGRSSDSSLKYARGGSHGSGATLVSIRMGGDDESYNEKIASILYSPKPKQ